MNPFEPTLYIRSADRTAIEEAFDALCAEDHYGRIAAPLDAEALRRSAYHPLLEARHRVVWAVSFSSGWTLVRASPAALLSERLREGERRFPSRLASRLGRDVFHVWIVDKDGGVLLHEATPDGRTASSGFDSGDPQSGHDDGLTEENFDARFRLIEPPPVLREVLAAERGIRCEPLMLVLSGAQAHLVNRVVPWTYELRTPAVSR